MIMHEDGEIEKEEGEVGKTKTRTRRRSVNIDEGVKLY